PTGRPSSEAEQMKSALRDFGVSAKWIESDSRNTLENARQTRKTLKQAGIERVYIVTHAWHMPRAKMAFQNAGLQVVPAATAYTTSAPV
ncbi:YdcF family protein, partial [Salmonella enterica]|uniref:YdcF family protein n=1 Tax=Salmonella enterica TaxID=28901 RepID=UPI0039EB2661